MGGPASRRVAAPNNLMFLRQMLDAISHQSRNVKLAPSASAEAPSLDCATRSIMISIMWFIRFVLRKRSTNA